MTECFKMTITCKKWHQPDSGFGNSGGLSIKRFVCRVVTTEEHDFVCEYVSESLTECIKKCLYDCWTVCYEYPDVFNTYPDSYFTDSQTFVDEIYAEKIRDHLLFVGYLRSRDGSEEEITF